MISWISHSIVYQLKKVLVFQVFVLIHVFKYRNLIKKIVRSISIINILVFCYNFDRKNLLEIVELATVDSWIGSHSQNWANFQVIISKGKNFDDSHDSFVNLESVMIRSCIIFPEIIRVLTWEWLSFATIFALWNWSIHRNLIF